MQVSPDDLIRLAQYLGVGGALALLIVVGALWRQIIWIGATVNLLLLEKDKQIAERDRRITALEAQVEQRQNLLDRTLELATVLKAAIGGRRQ